MMKFTAAASIFFLIASLSSCNGEERIVCYFAGYAAQRKVENRLTPIDLDPHLCTHIIYASAYPNFDYGIVPVNFERDVIQGYKELASLKELNPDLITLLSVEAIFLRSMEMSNIVADEAARSVFIAYVMNYLRRYQFDGVDIDWQYPGEVSRNEDKQNYAILISEMKRRFHKEALETNQPRLLISMAVPQKKAYIDIGYNLTSLNKDVDFFNVLSMDYHNSREPTVAHPAPLYPLPNQLNNRELNVDFTINYYLENGLDREKVNLGIPAYGTTFLIKNSNETDLGSPTRPKGLRHINIRETLPYFELCKYVINKGRGVWSIVHPDDEFMGPYAYYSDVWIGYDDEIIVTNKARYAKKNHLGGIVYWTIDQDDIHGECDQKYSLIKAGKKAFLENKVSYTETHLGEEIGHEETERPEISEEEVHIGQEPIYEKPEVPPENSVTEIDVDHTPVPHDNYGVYNGHEIPVSESEGFTNRPPSEELQKPGITTPTSTTEDFLHEHPPQPPSILVTSMPVESGFLRPIVTSTDKGSIDGHYEQFPDKPNYFQESESFSPPGEFSGGNAVTEGDLESADTSGSGIAYNQATTFRPKKTTSFVDIMVEEDTQSPVFVDKAKVTKATTPSSLPAIPHFMIEEDTESPLFTERPTTPPSRQRTRRPRPTRPIVYTTQTTPDYNRRRSTQPETNQATTPYPAQVDFKLKETEQSANTSQLVESSLNGALNLASAFFPNSSADKTYTNLTILNFLTPFLNARRDDSPVPELPKIPLNVTYLPPVHALENNTFPSYGFKEINSKRDVILQNVVIFVTNHNYFNKTGHNSTDHIN